MPVLRNRRLFGISIAALIAIGGLTYWIVTSLLPPRQVVEFVRLLNGPESKFYDALQATQDEYLKQQLGDWRPRGVESYRQFKSRGQGPWRLERWEQSKFGNRFDLIVRDSRGNRSHLDLIMTVPGGRIGAVQYWPFVKGETLKEIADSAMKITRTRALAVAYWKDGKYECEVRGNRSLTAQEPLRETDRWPLQFSAGLVQLTTARLVENGVLKWDELIKDRLLSYQLPDWAQGVTLGDLFQSGNRTHFSANDYGKPVQRQTLTERLNTLFRSDSIEGGDARLSESNDLTVLIGIIEQATNGPVENAIVREVFRPLGMKRADFGRPDVEVGSGETRDHSFGPREMQKRGLWYVADGNPVSASVFELMKLGVLKLEEEIQGSDFLRSEQFAKLRLAGVRNVYESKWEWWKRDLPEGTCYLVLRSSVMIGAFPKQNAVVIVAMPLLEEPYISLGGPVFWRIAEEICGWPKKKR